MQYRALGCTGLQVSAIGIGTWQLSGPLVVDDKADGFPDVGQDKAVDLIRSCADLGINLVDTAPIYGDGEGERRVGAATRSDRDKWIISTKFGLSRGSRGEKIRSAHPSSIQPCLEESLRRLQTSYVDLYLYHSPPEISHILAGREVLESLKQAGKIRFYGISTNDPKILGQLASRKAVDVVMFSQSLVTHPTKILNLVRDNSLGGIVRGALESGRLSGRYFHQPPQFSDQDIRSQAIASAEMEKYAVYEKFLSEGTSMPAFALRYLLDFDTTSTIVWGGKSIEQYQTAVKALDLPALSAQDHERLRGVRQRLLRKTPAQSMASLARRVVSRLT